MTTQELAQHLRLNERTVLKLASQGELPGVRLGNQWRFRRAVVDAWLDDQMLGVRSAEPTVRATPHETFSFQDEFSTEHIVPGLRGTTVPAVLAELARRAHALGLVRDPTWFLGALLERENVFSSAVGNGIAFPHTLNRHPEQVRRPFVVLGRSAEGIDFLAPDGQPVRIIVVMGLRHQELHLPWLRRLSLALQEPSTRGAILHALDAAEILAALHESLGVSEE